MPDCGSRGFVPYALNCYGLPVVVGHSGGVHKVTGKWFTLDDPEPPVWGRVSVRGWHLVKLPPGHFPRIVMARKPRAADASGVADLVGERPKVGR